MIFHLNEEEKTQIQIIQIQHLVRQKAALCNFDDVCCNDNKYQLIHKS